MFVVLFCYVLGVSRLACVSGLICFVLLLLSWMCVVCYDVLFVLHDRLPQLTCVSIRSVLLSVYSMCFCRGHIFQKHVLTRSWLMFFSGKEHRKRVAKHRWVAIGEYDGG